MPKKVRSNKHRIKIPHLPCQAGWDQHQHPTAPLQFLLSASHMLLLHAEQYIHPAKQRSLSAVIVYIVVTWYQKAPYTRGKIQYTHLVNTVHLYSRLQEYSDLLMVLCSSCKVQCCPLFALQISQPQNRSCM